MKRLVYILILLIFQLAFSQNEFIEKITLECYCEPFEKVGVDIIKELDKYETHLIQNGFLKDRSGRSYLTYFKNVVKSNRLSAVSLDSIKSAIVKADFLTNYNKECVLRKFEDQGNLLDNIFLKTTKLHKLSVVLKSINYEEQFFSSYANEILQILDEEDFEKPLYKTYFLHMIFVESSIHVNDLVLPKEDGNMRYKEVYQRKI